MDTHACVRKAVVDAIDTKLSGHNDYAVLVVLEEVLANKKQMFIHPPGGNYLLGETPPPRHHTFDLHNIGAMIFGDVDPSGPLSLLQYAVRACNYNVVEKLLEYGADANSSHVGPRMELRVDGEYAPVGPLDCLSEICIAPPSKDGEEIAEMLMRYGADLTTMKNQHGYPLLHQCCCKCELKLVKLLCLYDRHDSINKPFKLQSGVLSITPLAFAVRNASSRYAKRVVEVLVAHGADIYALDRFGHTLVHAIAASNTGYYNFEVLCYLVRRGVHKTTGQTNESPIALAHRAVIGNPQAQYRVGFFVQRLQTLMSMFERMKAKQRSKKMDAEQRKIVELDPEKEFDSGDEIDPEKEFESGDEFDPEKESNSEDEIDPEKYNF